MSQRWANWSGSVSAAPARIVRPQSEEEVVALVHSAAALNHPVRVVGSGHSFTPLCATDGLLISLDDLTGIESIDREKRQATIRGGSKIHDLGEPLAAAGLALANQGDVDVQAIAGAISTGTHGTGRTLGSLSTQLVGLRIVTADGRIVEFSAERNLDEFRAAQLSLGMLGVVTAVRIELVEAYQLHEVLRQVPIEACLATLEEQINANRHYEFFWYPATDRAHTKALNPTNQTAEDVAGVTGERIEASWRVFPTVRENRFNEMEFAVPEGAGPDCFRQLRDMMRRDHPEVIWPIEYRTQAADEIFLSPAYRRPTVTLSIHQDARQPFRRFFADAEAIFRDHEGRPHWGKIHWHSAELLQRLYPRWESFLAVRRRFDPQGRFLNPYLTELFGG